MGRPRSEPTRIQSVERAIRILLFVAESAIAPTAKQVAEQFDLALPTAYHLLNTLAGQGVLVKDDARRYYVGPEVGVLSDAFLRSLTVPEDLLVHLRQLADRTEETTYVSGWRGSEIVGLASIEGRHA